MILFGRTAALERLNALLDRVRLSSSPASIAVTGPSGIGKTALVSSLQAAARQDGWLVVDTVCRENQKDQAMSAVRQALRNARLELGSHADRYERGLEVVLSAKERIGDALFERAFVRFLEALALDMPILLSFDEAQWLDAESARVLSLAQQDLDASPLCLTSIHRSQATLPKAMRSEEMVLAPLSSDAAGSLVRDLFPGANEEVRTAILAHAQGVPINLQALAMDASDKAAISAEQVRASLYAVIAEQVAQMPAELREFLQLCSLIGDPIDLRIILQLYSGVGEIDALLAKSAVRYLIEDGASLRFTHGIVATAVSSTIPLELPFRRRILAALLELPLPTLGELEQIVQHALALGDRKTAREQLARLALESYRAAEWDTSADAHRRVLELMAPGPKEHVTFFARYASALRAHDREPEAEPVLWQAIRDGTATGLTEGMGLLHRELIVVLWDLQKTRQAFAVYESFLALNMPDEERAHVIAVVALISADAMDFVHYEALSKEFERVRPAATPHALADFRKAQSYVASRAGRYEEAKSLIAQAQALAGGADSLQPVYTTFAELLLDFRHLGVSSVNNEAPHLIFRRMSMEAGSLAFATMLRALAEFGAGDLPVTLVHLEELNRARVPLGWRASILSIAAAITSLSGRASEYTAEIDVLLYELEAAGWHESFIELASWAVNLRDLTFDRRAIRNVLLENLEFAPRISSPFMPVSIALFAERTADRELLAGLAAETQRPDAAPWARGHRLLARGVALDALKDKRAGSVLVEAVTAFRSLRAHFFAALAAVRCRRATPEERQLIESSGYQQNGKPANAPRGQNLSPREREVASLVSQGYSNRDVAERLLLSERTVEAHLTHIFTKTDLSSRTQLVHWVAENFVS